MSLIISAFTIQSSAQSVNCENYTNASLTKVYEMHKHSGLEFLIKEEFDMMQYLIDKLEKPDIVQMCIDAWYLLDQNGSEYTYSRFSRKFPRISKSDYLKNMYQLEMLAKLHEFIIDAH